MSASLKRLLKYSFFSAYVGLTSSVSFSMDLQVPSPEMLLPPPPPDSSIEAYAERAYIRQYLDLSTADQLKLAKDDAKNESVSFFESAIPGFQVADLPSTVRLFDRIRLADKKITERFKARFDRKRPYQVDDSIEPCLPPKKPNVSSSNPSGHAVMAYAFAIVLSELLPMHAGSIISRAELYSQNRILCGAHHPFDIRSGQVLGTVIGLEVLRSADFAPYLDAAKAELISKGLAIQ